MPIRPPATRPLCLCDDGTCFFAEEDLDCAGDCLGGDADGDGICDGDGFAGCTHPDACNVTGATEDDGSCFFPILAWPMRTAMASTTPM